MQSLDISDLAILLVEPSNMQLKIIIKHLQEEGVNSIDGVSTAAEAMEAIKVRSPDLVISSLYLPDMSALELVNSLKSDEATKLVPFMLISSETRFEVLDTFKQSGVVAILPKPFDHADLKRALRATLEYIDPQSIEFENYDIDMVRALVVDDSRMARKHIIRVLNNLGIKNITQAENGKQALQLFTEHEEAFDLIVTDCNMPEMDGEELVQKIRSELNNSFIPILMVTSEQNEARLTNIQQAGVSAICDKPFEPQTVKEMLFRVMDDAEV